MMHLCLALPTAAGVQKLAVFLLMLSVLVVLHEYGHFLIARLCRVRVNDFAVGFGPTLLKWTSPRSGTNYRVNVLPLGGYCAMQGEDGKSAATVGEDDNYQVKTPWQRLAIVLAGPFANFILAFGILAFSALVFGVPGDTFTPMIGQITPGSPGARAGLQFGDRVLAVDGVSVDGETMVRKIQASSGKRLRFRILRNGASSELFVTPKSVSDGHGKMVGRVGFTRVQEYKRIAPIAALKISAEQFAAIFNGTANGIAQLLSNPVKHYGNAVGVIGMERAASALQDLGWGPYFGLAGSLSVALGIFNLLPIPALDGGRALFILIELLRGRPLDPEREAFVHVAGFALLMALMVFIAFHDIANIISGKGVF